MQVETSTDRRIRTFQVEAIVLRHSDWGEADRLLWLFTLEMGKLRAVGKGIRKSHSRKAGHLEPFTHSRLQLARGRDFPIVTQADTIDAYIPLHEDLVKMTYAAYVVELLDRFTYEEGENQNLFYLLRDTLNRLCGEFPVEVVTHYFEMRLLDYTGFRPQLFYCALCGEKIVAEDQFYSASAGGVLCPKCGRKQEERRPISMRVLKYLRHFQRSNFRESLRARLTVVDNRQIETIQQYYLTYILERSLNTPPFIRRLRSDIKNDAGS